jgi:hypothetical protein
MIDQEYLLLIMNCNKYRYKSEIQKNTWLKTIPTFLKYFHVIGNELLETEYMFDNENNILWVKVADDYISLPKKVIAAYYAVTKIYNFKYIFKTDDDQILIKNIFFDKIINLLLHMTPTPHYGGKIVDVKKPHISEYYKIHSELPHNIPVYVTKYCNGRFYFLSKKAIEYLLKQRTKIENEYFEDYAIGYYLKNKYKENILSISTERVFKDIEA